MQTLLIILGITGLFFIIIVIMMVHRGREKEDLKSQRHLRTLSLEVESKDRKIKELQSEVERLTSLNERYLNFMLNIPEATKRLSTQMDFNEIILEVAKLINAVVSAEIVEIYIYQEERLRRFYPKGEELSFAIGEGLIGRAARDRIAKIKGITDKGLGVTYTKHDEKLSMAVPIQFHDILLGVIAIGRLTGKMGSEKDVIRLIADIAATSLINQRTLDVARVEASTDPLTGLYNRRFFFDMAHKELHKASERGMPVSFFMFDIDNFKNYNDLNGHAEGDKLLKELGSILKEVTRKSACAARYGGEEFIVMLPSSTKDEAFIYAERLREKIALHPFPHREKQPFGFVSISGGVSEYPTDGRNLDELIKAADKAIYEAKRTGKNKIKRA